MHAKYGPQLKAMAALPLDPVDRAGQIAYLTTLKHIGPARAERLCDTHGEEVLEVIAANPYSTFSALKGLSAGQAAAAAESWTKTRAVRDLHVHLAPHGLAHLAAAINARYGDDALTILHEDPYRLTEVDGVGFARADAIALAADVPPTSSRRAEAATVHVLGEAERDGHTHLPLEELRRRTAKLLGAVPDIDVLAGAPGTRLEEGCLYREGTLRCEQRVAATLGARAAADPIIDHDAGRRADRRPHRRAVGRGARRVRVADLRADRRPRRRQDRLHPGDRRGGQEGRRPHRALRARPAAPPAACRRRPATPRRRSTA